MFNGFDTKRIAVGDTDFHIRIGGSGPPVLLLHGFPQTHHAWHQVAPLLAERFTVIVPDTPGYGATHGPEPTVCLLYTSPSPRDRSLSRMPSSA